MQRIPFVDKWRAASQLHESQLALGLAPRLNEMPAPMTRYDDPFLPFGRAIIRATADLCCAVVFDLAAYLAIGAAGAIALERTIPLVPEEMVTILHGPFSTGDYVAAAFEGAFNVDAVTLASGAIEVISGYVRDDTHGAFVSTASAMTLPGGNVGFFDARSLEISNIRAMWISTPIAFASRGEGFEAEARKAAERYRIESLK
jgi:hypothetical protein